MFYNLGAIADPADKSCLIWVLPVYLYRNMIRYDPTLVDLTSNFFVLCTNVKVCLYNHSKICLKQPLKNRPNKSLKTNGSLMQVKSIAECSPWSIMQGEHSAILLTCIKQYQS